MYTQHMAFWEISAFCIEGIFPEWNNKQTYKQNKLKSLLQVHVAECM